MNFIRLSSCKLKVKILRAFHYARHHEYGYVSGVTAPLILNIGVRFREPVGFARWGSGPRNPLDGTLVGRRSHSSGLRVSHGNVDVWNSAHVMGRSLKERP